MTLSHSGTGRVGRQSDRAGSRAVREFLARQVEACPVGSVAAVTLPAPGGSAAEMLRVDPAGPGVFWQNASGESWVGSGAAAVVTAVGPARFTTVRTAGREVLDGCVTTAFGEAAPLDPRMFGGFAFATGSAAAPPWQPLAEALFVLPRWTLVERDGGRWLLAVVPPGLDERASVVEEYDAVRRTLAGAPPEVPPGEAVAIVPEDGAAWRARVEAIREMIRCGECEKIVAARSTMLRFGTEIDVVALLGRLGATFPTCTRFAVRRGGTAFVGATPEHLVAVRGLAVESEALAGSIAARTDAAPSLLLASEKDNREHRLVLRQIVETLREHCRTLSWSTTPGVRALHSILHLHTPIHGELAARTHVLDLVAALHPTPAVGGVPTQVALAWVAANEAVPRGWYAGPVGWFDAGGDGDFVVGLRSGVIRDREAIVHAGAGIVADSDPDREFAETELKQEALFAALGVPR